MFWGFRLMNMHHQLIKTGIFELYYGAMKSGKSKALINRVEQLRFLEGVEFFIVQPRINTRETKLKSRFSEMSLPTIVIDEKEPAKILDKVTEKTKLIAIDEIQFFDETIVDVIYQLQLKGINVVAAGLNTDFRGEPFGPMAKLMTLVDEPYSLAGVCDVDGCNRRGTRTQRLIGGKPAHYDEPIVLIDGTGAKEEYQTRCLLHHKVLKD